MSYELDDWTGMTVPPGGGFTVVSAPVPYEEECQQRAYWRTFYAIKFELLRHPELLTLFASC